MPNDSNNLYQDGSIMANKQIIEVDFKEEFSVCPTCGYRDGFHSIFRGNNSELKWLLICPACHDTFDIGLSADITIKDR
jgi:Zn finger protein HypA/HybF involved in hydrogenase expression